MRRTRQVADYLLGLQQTICDAFERLDAGAAFSLRELPGAAGGLSRPGVLEGGEVFERAAVHFTHSVGASLPAAATERNPRLAGKGFEAVAVSVIVHPQNPYVPTMHANLRFFLVADEVADKVSADEAADGHWYFGGGFDLTPCYPFREDVVHWHRTARDACRPFGEDVYPHLKRACDEYFFLGHRNEARGVGGLFFDDWTRGGFQRSFDLTRSIGDRLLPAYLPIVERRRGLAFGRRERDFQLYRRGRYAEFNLVIDRGTRYGLQSGRRVESVLASMPPMATWKYDWQPAAGSPEAALYEDFLPVRDWLEGE